MSYTYRDFDIIDAHTHIYPSKIATKAAQSIGEFYGLQPGHDGSVEELLENGKQYGVNGYLVCSVATAPEQVASINNFIADECSRHSAFYGFGTLHPRMEDVGVEVDRIVGLGLSGIKLHPDFQTFNIDSPEAYTIYEAVAGRLPILFHMGDDRYDYSRPMRLAKALEDFPQLQAIAAHMGGYRAWDEARAVLRRENVKFDTSSTLPVIGSEAARAQIQFMGVENCFFGTDYPLWDYGQELARFFELGLTYAENQKILSGNFKEFIGGARCRTT